MQYTIIGAGIGGLTTALAFEKQGIDYQIVEKVPEIQHVGAGIWLAPNALQVFSWLGIVEDVQANANVIDRITLTQANLDPLSDTDQAPIEETFGFATLAIHRATLQQVLLEKIPQEKLHLGKAFSSFKKTGEGKVCITFEDHSTIETDAIIGADGIHSKVRKQLFPKSELRYSGQTCWRGVASYTLPQELMHRGMELWGNQIRFGITQVADNQVYWFAVVLSLPNQKDESTTQAKEWLLQEFQSFNTLVTTLIHATPPSQIIRNDIYDLKPLDRWYQDEVCLLGDAAHATTPNMGQGGAQAIEDAYYLSHFIKQTSDHSAFPRFQAQRQKKVNTVVAQSWTTGQMAHWKYGKRFRNFILKNLPKAILQKQIQKLYRLEAL